MGSHDPIDEVQEKNDEQSNERYVNVYAIKRCYGGPEEGGWWFDAGEPVECYFCPSEETLQHFLAKATEEWEGHRDVDIIVQSHPAREFPERRPHYE
jgi:hypothetical protein